MGLSEPPVEGPGEQIEYREGDEKREEKSLSLAASAGPPLPLVSLEHLFVPHDALAGQRRVARSWRREMEEEKREEEKKREEKREEAKRKKKT